MDLSSKSTDELMKTAFECLMELKKRTEKEPANVTFMQTKEVIVRKKGIPADRKGWLYLPFISHLSGHFQPIMEAGGKIYRSFFQQGEILEIGGGNVSKQVVVKKGSSKIVEIGDSYIRGPVEIL